MFSVFKFYENPAMLVKSKYHNDGSDEYMEVRELVPKIKFFDAPVKLTPLPTEAVVDAEKLPAAVTAEWKSLIICI